MKANRVLFLATVDSHIYYFHIPFMKLLRDMGYEVEVACSNVGFTEKIEEEGFKVYNISFSRNPLSFTNIKAAAILLKLIKKNKYIMVHTHTPVASFIGRIVVKLAGAPHIVYTAHGFHFHEHGNKLKNFVYYRLEKFAGRFTDVLITINKDDYRIAVERKMIPNGKVFYVKGVGVDTERFNPLKVEKKDLFSIEGKTIGNLGDSLLVSIGRLEHEKHFDHILKALFDLKSRGKILKCLIAGDGPLKDYLVNLSKKLGMEKDFFIIGYTKNVVELLSISDIFVFTSSREGLPVSVVEAMAMEKPVVAYNIRGVRDLVVDGKTGFLIPFGNVEAFAEKIIYLIEHPEVARAMGEMGRERIEKEFSLDVILQQMEVLYKEILESEYN